MRFGRAHDPHPPPRRYARARPPPSASSASHAQEARASRDLWDASAAPAEFSEPLKKLGESQECEHGKRHGTRAVPRAAAEPPNTGDGQRVARASAIPGAPGPDNAEHRLTWDDVLAGPMTGERLAAEQARAMAEVQTQPKASWTTPTGSRGRAAPRARSRTAKPSFETTQAAREDADWRRHQLFCLKHLDQLSIVEQAFVRSIGLTGRPRTQRRRMVVELAARLRAAGAPDDPP